MSTLILGSRIWPLDRPYVMGIVNVTPDSFSGNGALLDFEQSLKEALTMIDDGADIIDVGGESSRPGAQPVSDDEELRRVLPLIEALAARGVAVSVDTIKPIVMQAAIDAGAVMINDIQALQVPKALDVVVRSRVAVCLMHMQGAPRTMQEAPVYGDVVTEVKAFLSTRADVLQAAGVARERIVLDPGFGFGKTVAHNLALMQKLPELVALGYPLLVGWSRKSTLGHLTGRDVSERLEASVAANLAAVAQGAAIVRAHDVRATVDALRVWGAMVSGQKAFPVGKEAPEGKPEKKTEGKAMTKRRYFGTDGIRGRVGTAPITPEFALKLGWAAGRVLARYADARHPDARGADHAGVLIGKDTRSSGYLLEAALEAGLSAAGVDVYLTGPLPTPAVAYLTRALRRSAGIVISASHNPYPDNGIKFFSAAGTKLPDAIETAIEEELEQPLHCVAADALGKVWRVNDAAGRYIEFCKSAFPNELDLKGWRIVVDCAHGAAYHVAPPVLHELGAEVITVAAEPNGLNINDAVGAVHTAFLAEQVKAHQADLGLALDGDGDRLMMADAKGRIYDGDVLLYIIARDYQRRGVAMAGVVGTLMSNLGLEQALSHRGLALERTEVGDRYVMERLLRKGWLLGGENSGHLICLDKHSTGDGIVAALAVLRALIEQQASLEEAAREVALYPQSLINVPLKADWRWQDSALLQAEETAMTKTLGRRGRLLLRASGTEPLLRVMVEAEDEALARTSAAHLAETVRKAMQEEVAS